MEWRDQCCGHCVEAGFGDVAEVRNDYIVQYPSRRQDVESLLSSNWIGLVNQPTVARLEKGGLDQGLLSPHFSNVPR